MIIDVHGHVTSERLLARLAQDDRFSLEARAGGGFVVGGFGASLDPGVYAHDERLARMAGRGVDLELVSPIANFLSWPGGAADAEFARHINRSTADCVAGSGGRFAGLAALGLGEPERAASELERAIDEYGLVGVAIGTYAGDRPLDHPSLDPVFAAIERMGLVLFMHPNSAEDLPRFRDYTLTTILAWPNETTLAVSRLIFGGTLERHPNLRLVVAHGGGSLVFLKGRLDLAYAASEHEYNPDCHAHITRAPSEYYDQLLFDTVVAAPESLRFLIQAAGPEHVVFGSDDPFEIGDPGGAVAMPVIHSLPAADRERILGATLARMLGARLPTQ